MATMGQPARSPGSCSLRRGHGNAAPSTTLHKQHTAPAPTPLGAAATRTTTHTGKRATPLTSTEHTAMLTSRTAETAALALAPVVAAVAVAVAVALIIEIVLVIATATPGLQRGRWRHRPHRKHRPTNTGRAAMATASRPRRDAKVRIKGSAALCAGARSSEAGDWGVQLCCRQGCPCGVPDQTVTCTQQWGLSRAREI